MQAASGELQTKRSEDRIVDAHLRRARLLVNQARAQEAESLLQDILEKFPGRADVYANLAWANKRARDWAAARMHFKRARELGCNDRDAFWHWSEMEAVNGEWRASAQAAEAGLTKFPDDQGLLFRHGYALHRAGKELFLEGQSSQGVSLCRKAQNVLEQALRTRNAEERNYSLRSQVFRAIVLNHEVMDEGDVLPKRFAEWSKECPGDSQFTAEYDRLRRKYPQFLRQH